MYCNKHDYSNIHTITVYAFNIMQYNTIPYDMVRYTNTVSLNQHVDHGRFSTIKNASAVLWVFGESFEGDLRKSHQLDSKPWHPGSRTWKNFIKLQHVNIWLWLHGVHESGNSWTASSKSALCEKCGTLIWTSELRDKFLISKCEECYTYMNMLAMVHQLIPPPTKNQTPKLLGHGTFGAHEHHAKRQRVPDGICIRVVGSPFDVLRPKDVDGQKCLMVFHKSDTSCLIIINIH